MKSSKFSIFVFAIQVDGAKWYALSKIMIKKNISCVQYFHSISGNPLNYDLIHFSKVQVRYYLWSFLWVQNHYMDGLAKEMILCQGKRNDFDYFSSSFPMNSHFSLLFVSRLSNVFRTLHDDIHKYVQTAHSLVQFSFLL